MSNESVHGMCVFIRHLFLTILSSSESLSRRGQKLILYCGGRAAAGIVLDRQCWTKAFTLIINLKKRRDAC